MPDSMSTGVKTHCRAAMVSGDTSRRGTRTGAGGMRQPYQRVGDHLRHARLALVLPGAHTDECHTGRARTRPIRHVPPSHNGTRHGMGSCSVLVDSQEARNRTRVPRRRRCRHGETEWWGVGTRWSSWFKPKRMRPTIHRPDLRGYVELKASQSWGQGGARGRPTRSDDDVGMVRRRAAGFESAVL